MKPSPLQLSLTWMLGVLAAALSMASAAEFTVTTFDDEISDPGAGLSLREAIIAANVSTGDDTIVLPAGTHTLSLTGLDENAASTGDLDITDSTGTLTITGQGAAPADTVVDAAQIDRVFHVLVGANVTFENFTITGGKSADGAFGVDGDDGGGIFNAGDLVLRRCSVTGNTTGGGGSVNGGLHGLGGGGGDGGGIFNAGDLVLRRCSVTGNTTGAGGSVNGGLYGLGGDGGNGGGCYTSGTLTLENTTVSGNQTGGGGDGSAEYSDGGDGGNGGGCYNNGILTLENTTVSDNQTGKGGKGADDYSDSGNGGKGGDGGGCYNISMLTLENTTLSDNQTGKGGDGGNCFDVGNSGDGGKGGDGGGCYTSGSLALVNVTVLGNQTGDGGKGGDGDGGGGGDGGKGGDGGGCYTSGSLTLENVTALGNQTGDGGKGGDGNDEYIGRGGDGGSGGSGGGCFTIGSGIVTIQNATLAGNQTGDGGFGGAGFAIADDGSNGGNGGFGGGIFGSSSNSLLHVTISENTVGSGGLGQAINGSDGSGGGYYLPFSGDTLTLENCVVAGNTTPSGDDNVAGTGTLIKNGANLDSGDPMLSPLANYGGPTETMPPLPGSPAVDATTSSLTTDQRGAPRPSGPVADIGAVELQQEILVTTAVDENDGSIDPASGVGTSLREAIEHGPGEAEMVRFDPALDDHTFTLGGTELALDRSLAIDASALPTGITLDGTGLSRIATVSAGSTVLITGVTLTGGLADEGGAIVNEGVLTLRNATFSDNATTAGRGGALLNRGVGASVRIEACTFSNNAATGGNGGAIFNNWVNNADVAQPSLEIFNSTFSANSSSDQGGAIHIGGNGTSTDRAGSAELVFCTLVGNTSQSHGGGLRSHGHVTLKNTIIALNTSISTPNEDFRSSVGSATVTVSDVNLIGDLTGSGLTVGSTLLAGDPRLAPLANYGGPTKTMPPLPGSTALEAGILSAAAPTVDQRGAPRPSGPLPDIGALEGFAFSTIPLVDTDNDGIDDRLEPAYGLTVPNDDSASDQDHDGQTDAQEIGNMTNPLDANSRFALTGLAKTGTDPGTGAPVFTLTFPCFPGLSYSIEADAELDFADPDQTLGPVLPTGHSHTQDVTLMPGRDFVRVRRN